MPDVPGGGAPVKLKKEKRAQRAPWSTGQPATPLHAPASRARSVAPVLELSSASANKLAEQAEFSAARTAAASDAGVPDAAEAYTITVRDGYHPETADQIEEVFVRFAKQQGIFQRGGEIT